MNFELLAQEIRELAGDDVDSHIELGSMSDQEVVQHIITCPCCEEKQLSDSDLQQMVTQATSLEDFINRFHICQASIMPLTLEEAQIASDIIEGALSTTLETLCNIRGIPKSDFDGRRRVVDQIWTIAEGLIS